MLGLFIQHLHILLRIREWFHQFNVVVNDQFSMFLISIGDIFATKPGQQLVM